MQEAAIWKSLGIEQAYLIEKAAWLAEERDLHDRSLVFFRDAGKLLSLARYDYQLSNLVFFLAILGVERALKLHYRAEDESFKQLLENAVVEGIICDSIFQRVEPLSKDLNTLVEGKHESHSRKLISLIPGLRNSFFHGSYWLSPEFLALSLQMREIADALQTKPGNRTPSS